MPSIAIVGEFWGTEEAESRQPFIGTPGKELAKMLAAAGIDMRACFLTHVFNIHPPRNDGDYFFGSAKEQVDKSYGKFGAKYLLSQHTKELLRLKRELEEIKPNIIIALGGVASWALMGLPTIKKIRGFVAPSHWGYKILPTYQPSAVLREWNLRPTVILDFKKALRESSDPRIKRPRRLICVEPSTGDLETFEREHITSAKSLCIDIETIPSAQQITCIGFAPTPEIAIVVPFYDWRKPGWSYWKTEEEERFAWRWCKRICESPIPKINQNIMFDAQFLWMKYGIAMRNIQHDTMLAHHAMFPESQKDLGFLASIYTDELSWKSMRHDASFKKEE